MDNQTQKNHKFVSNGRAVLLSVYDKTDVVRLARDLYYLGYTILSSGGTYAKIFADFVQSNEFDMAAIISVEEYTNSPEMLGGRVKTLHPKIHGGILAQRNLETDIKDMATAGILPIDLVAVTLYPFEETIACSDTTVEDAIEQIDIGGVALLRAASKNHAHVVVLTDPKDYKVAVSVLRASQSLEVSSQQVSSPAGTDSTGKSNAHMSMLCKKYRLAFATKSFQYTAHYEACISQYFLSCTGLETLEPLEVQELSSAQEVGSLGDLAQERVSMKDSPKTKVAISTQEMPQGEHASGESNIVSSIYNTLPYKVKEVLRYGENPHQNAILYEQSWPRCETGSLVNAQQLHGKALSYNNIRDGEASIQIVKSFLASDDFDGVISVGVKHGNPCGVAISDSVANSWRDCYAADSVSIFGGIVAVSQEIDEETALMLSEIFLEIIIAPKFSDAALKILTKKKNVRLLQLDYQKKEDMRAVSKNTSVHSNVSAHTAAAHPQQYVSIYGGILAQDMDLHIMRLEDLQCVTEEKPSEALKKELLFAWNVCKFVKSNAIVVSNHYTSAGIGAGQMNRVGAAAIALEQAKERNLAQGANLASDAFFPMKDTVELAARYGITAIIQPGGSIKDQESIDMCNSYNISMVFTNTRHFLH